MSNCPNCKLFHHICKAECCTMVPIEKKLFDDNFHKITQPVEELVPFSPGIVVPVTANGKCPFLQEDFGCAIWETRPPLCRKFGDETHPQMTCVHQTKDGHIRSNKDKKRLHKIQLEATKKIFRK